MIREKWEEFATKYSIDKKPSEQRLNLMFAFYAGACTSFDIIEEQLKTISPELRETSIREQKEAISHLEENLIEIEL